MLKPVGESWTGFTEEQAELLDTLDYVGNNGWDRNGQTDELMPNLLAQFEEAGLSMTDVKSAMRRIGYDDRTLRQLDRWESKRRTGKFGR